MSRPGQPGSITVTKPLSTAPLLQNSTWKTNFQPNHFTSLLCSPFRFLFTFPGVVRRPMPSGAQRKLSETGKTPKSHSPTPEGVGLPRAITSLHGRQKLLQSKGVGVVHDKLLQKGFRLSVSGGSFPPRPPARFAMPAARGKTSLNARDW